MGSLNPGGASLATLARMNLRPDRRLPHFVAPLGDSRVAAVYADNLAGQRRQRASNSPLNMANALLGHRLIIGEGYGVSGDRTDQVMARLDAAIASGAGTLYLQCGLNDIAQNYPTAVTSGTVAFANIEAMANVALAAGMAVVIELEVGSNTINAAQVQQLVELNARLCEYAEFMPGVYLHDARPVVLQPGFSATLINYRAGYVYDGVHTNARGALYWAESLAALLGQIALFPRPGTRAVNRYQQVAVGRRQMLSNGLFSTATGGTNTGAFGGDIPANWTSGKTVAATVNASSAANPDNVGNALSLACAFTAQGQQVRLYQDVANPAHWNPGEYYEAFAQIRINSAAALSNIHVYGQCNADSQSYDFSDGVQDNSWLGPDHAAELTLVTRPFRVPVGTVAKGWLTAGVRLYSSGAGAADVTLRQIGLRRRDSGY